MKMHKTIHQSDKCPLYDQGCGIGRVMYSSKDFHHYCEKHWKECPSYIFQMKKLDNPSLRGGVKE